jgi:DNA-binding NtrC family response regulator
MGIKAERGVVMLEVGESRVDDASRFLAQTETELDERIEALREVAVSLLKEVEGLREPQTLSLPPTIKLPEEVRRFETVLISQALQRTGGNQTRAARLLGVKVTTLNTKIKRYNIPLPSLVPLSEAG